MDEENETESVELSDAEESMEESVKSRMKNSHLYRKKMPGRNILRKNMSRNMQNLRKR